MMNKFLGILLAFTLLFSGCNAMAETIALTVAGTGVNPELLAEYSQAHPHVEFRLIERSRSKELVEDAITRDDAVDIYFFHSLLSTAYPQLRDRGYMKRLTDPDLLRTINAYYPEIIRACSSDEGVCALPMNIILQPSIGYSKSLWLELGLEEAEIPNTWEAFLNFIVHEWPALAAEHPDIALFNGGDLRELLQGALNNYEDYRSLKGFAPRYDSETFQSILNLFQQIDASAFDSMADRSLFDMNYHPDIANREEQQLLPLSFVEGERSCLGFAMYVAAINPNAKNFDVAQDVLKFVAENMDLGTKVSMSPENDTPILSETYRDTLDDYNAIVLEYEQKIASASDADRQPLEQELEIYKQNVDALLAKYKYSASGESIARYRAEVEGRLVPIYATSISDEEQNALYDKQTQFLDGYISVEQYTRELQRRFEFAAMEDNA